MVNTFYLKQGEIAYVSAYHDRPTGAQTAAAANMLNGTLAASDIFGLNPTGLQLGSTLGDTARLNRSIAHEVTALRSLGRVVVAGMGYSN